MNEKYFQGYFIPIVENNDDLEYQLLLSYHVSQFIKMSSSNSSMRFIIQMIMNVYICKSFSQKLNKITARKEGKRSLKTFLIFMAFIFVLLGVNMAVYKFFKPLNLYEEAGVSRSMSQMQVRKYGGQTIQKMRTMKVPQQSILKFKSMILVLEHPARRLSYDTFGHFDTEYAWAFKSHAFLLSTIISSSMFYIICIFLNLVSDAKGEVKAAFKVEITVLIMLFLWEIQLILKTQSRFNQHTDFIDHVFTAFPIFERREMLKIILIPSMNIMKFFFRYFVASPSEKKFLKLAKNPELKKLTVRTSDFVNQRVKQIDEKLEDNVSVALTQAANLKKDEKIDEGEIKLYSDQRKMLQYMLYYEGENILPDEEINMLLRYYMIK